MFFLVAGNDELGDRHLEVKVVLDRTLVAGLRRYVRQSLFVHGVANR
jgi:hypothetical protein